MSNSEQHAAILFCEGGKIAREMLSAEFEAILDSFVPLPEYAGQDIKAIYVEISPQLKVTAAVYFIIGFDGAGNADRKWNIPLSQLADQGESGPNLGGGPIRLACRSQCPVAWHVQQLWDPNMNSDPNDFVLLRDVIKRNKLGFKKGEPEPEVLVEEPPTITSKVKPTNTASRVLHESDDPSEADKALANSLVHFLRQKLSEENTAELEDLSKKQRLLLAAQKTQFEDEINKLESLHSEELRQIQQELQKYHEGIVEQKKLNEKLEKQLQQENSSIAQTKKMFEQKMAKSQEAGSSQIETLREGFADEMQRQIDLITKDFNEAIAAKDMEIAYRDDEKAALQTEISKLNAEKALIIGQGGEQFINRLKENQVSFVVFHQGAGHINIEIDAIGEYLSNPIAYAARSCKVVESAYRQWLAHHDSPVCQSFSDLKGEVCGKKLKSVISPSQFVPGRSDRCPLHWSFAEEVKTKS